ncbi:MAG: aldehyde dehydrogenase [Aeromonas sp.]
MDNFSTATPRTRADWHAYAQQLSLPNLAFINGKWCPAASGATLACENPSTGEVLTHVAACDRVDADRAVAAARAAFNDRRWCGLAPAERKRILLRWAALLREQVATLALLESLDMGKPISDTLGYDAPAAANCIAWHAEAIDKLYDQVAPVADSALALICREPMGVVAAIVPWNFPLVMACWKLAPALATGNSVLLKPSEKSPLSALFIAELAHQAGLPAGVLNVLPGLGSRVGEALARHADVDCLAFTGSTAVGKHLLVCAGESNMKRTFMECGGKSAHLILADVVDLDAAARSAAAAIFYNQGEVCSAGSRLLLARTLAATFMPRLLHYAAQWQAGDPLDPATRLGPLVDAAQCQRVADYVASGVAEGASLLLGGERLSHGSGYYFAPTIFTDVTAEMRIFREEIFGPVLTVTLFDSLPEAIALANDSDYGLAAGIWTADLNQALRCARQLRAGSVFINNWDGGDMTMPFGGFKQSGNGRDKSLHAMEKYTELKSTWLALTP